MLLENNVAFCQMPCPEITYMGSRRWGMVKEMYSTPMFRKHCRKIASDMCDLAQTYEDNDHLVLGFIMRDGSSTCGLKNAAVSEDEDQVWGGMVWNACPLQKFEFTQGVFTEELEKELNSRSIDSSFLYIIPEVVEAGNLEKEVKEIERKIILRMNQFTQSGVGMNSRVNQMTV